MADHDEGESSPNWGTFNLMCQSIVARAKQEIEVYPTIASAVQEQNSCEEITTHLASINEVNTYVNTLLNQMQLVSASKCDESACRLRQLGNEAFKDGDHEKAAHFYTRGLMVASVDGEEYVHCLANRSAALFHLKEYQDALLDTHPVMNSPKYPDDRKCILYGRRISCLRKLGLDEEADLEAEKAVDVAKCSKDEKSLMQLQSFILDSANLQPDPPGSKKLPVRIDTLLRNPHESIEGACSKVSIGSDEHKGRCVMATESIGPSEVILKEDPFITWLEPKFYYSYCLHCLTCIENKHSLPCESCTRVLFCSEHCRQAAYKEYHEKECLHMLLLVRLSRAHTAIRIILKVGLDAALSYNSLGKSRDSAFEYASDYSIIRTYIDHLNDVNSDIRLGFALVSLMVTKLIFPQDERVAKIAGLVMKHSLQVWCNALSIEHDLDGSTKFLQCNTRTGAKIIGIGVYPIITLMNHACEKKTYVIYRGKHLTIKSVGEFKAGDEVTFNYGPWDKKMSFKDRQKCLKQNFMFTCTCISCSEKRECIEESFCCYECNGPAVINYSDGSSNCTICNKLQVVHIEQVQLVRAKIRPLLEQSSKFILEGTLDKAEDILANLVRNLTGLFHPISNTMISMKENLANLLEKQGRWKESAELRKECLLAAKEQSEQKVHFNHLYFNMKISKMLLSECESTKNLTSLPQAVEFFHEATNLLKEVARKEALILEAPSELIRCLPELEELREKLELLIQTNKQ